jgi:succinate dehydrogenase/fumarate reductase flavoprotein subunit
MLATHIEIAGLTHVPVYVTPNLIVGSGAAGLNCAEHLAELGQPCVIVTDCLGGGTSNNCGSDKQTYYKLGVFGDVPDSPLDFAQSLFQGGMTHGDLAYCEALGSLPEFYHLVRNGVAFPCNRYGAYVGYKTDHDPRQRATSAGPKTSMQMVQCSLARLRTQGVQIFDGYEVIRLLTSGVGDNRRVVGALALNLAQLDTPAMGLTLFWADNLILATGGPGELYADSVYPRGQIGNHGLALEIGAQANNLSELQFGLASTGFRWNLSGTYQQVIPSYFSTDERSDDRREFLFDYYPSADLVAANTFLKGYQWPFHASRLQNYGSSIIDLAVHEERLRGRKVYLDFTRNVGGAAFDLSLLPPESRQYLERSGATQPTPYERLQHMNPLAIEIYAEHDVDLREPLEVAVCAQHCNGGLSVNIWWQTSIAHLFAIGEIAGTHGVRPGGSALNSGQVGGLRVAQYLAAHPAATPDPEALLPVVREQLSEEVALLRSYANAPASALPAAEVRENIQTRMSTFAAFLRTPDGIERALVEARQLLGAVRHNGLRVDRPADLPLAVQDHHLCLTQLAFLSAMHDLLARGGGSRGGYAVVDREGDCVLETAQGPRLPHRSENLPMRHEIIETRFSPAGECEVSVTRARPLPQDDSWYETTWQAWREGKVFE